MATKKNDETTAAEATADDETTEKESPEDRFKRVAGTRVQRALDALDTVAAAGKSKIMLNDDEQADKIVAALTEKVEEVKNALHTDKSKGKAEKAKTFEL